MEITSSHKFDPCIEVAAADVRVGLLIERRYQEALYRIDWHLRQIAFKHHVQNSMKEMEDIAAEAAKLADYMVDLAEAMRAKVTTPKKKRRWFERKTNG